MSTPENDNPFDQTIWDPVNPEHAIEDPMHGPSAVGGLLSTPPMPRGDGSYYQSGGFYAFGSVYIDARDQPIYVIGLGRTTSAIRREAYEFAEWRQASQTGEEALTALETRRQQARLDANRVAHAFKPSDVCGGGKRLENCETASTMMEAASAYADSIGEEGDGGKGRMWSTLAWLGKTCATCSLHCEVAVQTQDGKPTGITRFSNARPLAADFPVVRLDLPKYDDRR
jgi:hypothetical protein